MTEKIPTVLIAEDEVDLADIYANWLSDSCDVRVAYSGEEARDKLSSDLDIAFLDRRLPDLPGDEILEEIRNRDINCRVAMLTAVTPDFDIIDMEFDAYIEKPVTRDEIRNTLTQLLTLANYDGQIQQYFSLAVRSATLEGEKTDEELAESDKYRALQDELGTYESKLDDQFQTLWEAGEFDSLFRELDRGYTPTDDNS